VSRSTLEQRLQNKCQKRHSFNERAWHTAYIQLSRRPHSQAEVIILCSSYKYKDVMHEVIGAMDVQIMVLRDATCRHVPTDEYKN
jgi:hypothetical protein